MCGLVCVAFHIRECERTRVLCPIDACQLTRAVWSRRVASHTGVPFAILATSPNPLPASSRACLVSNSANLFRVVCLPTYNIRTLPASSRACIMSLTLPVCAGSSRPTYNIQTCSKSRSEASEPAPWPGPHATRSLPVSLTNLLTYLLQVHMQAAVAEYFRVWNAHDEQGIKALHSTASTLTDWDAAHGAAAAPLLLRTPRPSSRLVHLLPPALCPTALLRSDSCSCLLPRTVSPPYPRQDQPMRRWPPASLASGRPSLRSRSRS